MKDMVSVMGSTSACRKVVERVVYTTKRRSKLCYWRQRWLCARKAKEQPWSNRAIHGSDAVCQFVICSDECNSHWLCLSNVAVSATGV